MITSNKEFAEKYAGYEVKLIDNIARGHSILGTIVGRVVGYNPHSDNIVILEIIDVIERFGNGQPIEEVSYTKTADTITSKPFYYRFYCKELVPVRKSNVKPVVAYPHNCKSCKAPARKVGKIFICSRHCSKSSKTLGFYKRMIAPVILTHNKHNYVLCPQCGSLPTGITGTNYINVTCVNGHKFEHTWKAGERINYAGHSRYIWRVLGSRGSTQTTFAQDGFDHLTNDELAVEQN